MKGVIAGLAVALALSASTAQAQTITLPSQFQLQELPAGVATYGPTAMLLKKDRGPHPATSAAITLGGGQYQLIGASQLGMLPTVDILAIHYIKVQPAKAAAFEKFVADKLNPTVGTLRPDLRLLYYKATSGPNAGSYISVFALTRASRDKYWPNGSDSEDLKAAFTPQIKALATELETYLVPDSFGVGMTAAVFEAKDWADWGIVAK
jgi:hypothetical protein